jgi:hypothetical protein
MQVRRQQARPRNIEGSLRVVSPAYRLPANDQNGELADGRWPAAVGLSWAALLIGLMPVATALVRGSTWDAEPTIGLVLACLGAAGLGRYYACAARDWAQRRSGRRRPTQEV